MKLSASIGAIGLLVTATSIADAATITGTVTGPDGAPFRAAFVQARNAKMKMTVSVLTDNQGHYRADNLPAGDYRLSIHAPGFKADPKSAITLTADQSLSQNFALQKGMVRWNEISQWQGHELFPNARGKDLLFNHCFACHGFQTRMASVKRDEDGWRTRVAYMRDAMGFFISEPRRGFTDEKAEDVVWYMNQLFGEDSVLPKSPTEVPNYESTVRKFSDEALKIVYVEYETPGPSRMPWSAHPDGKGSFWVPYYGRANHIARLNPETPGSNRMPWSAHPDGKGSFWVPYYGRANKIARLNPETGEMQEYPVPNMGTAAIHSAVPAPDGSVWLTEQGSDKIGRWDPKTQTVTEYQDTLRKHTIRIDPKTGQVWSSGALTRFDPKTEKFDHIPEVPTCYGIALDANGNAWFTELLPNGKIGMVDAKTLKVTKYVIPTQGARPRRIQVDDEGIVWFGEFDGGKIGRFDPKTETFKEFTLPGPYATPYALGIDAEKKLWYSSEYQDVLGRVDPVSGQVIEYPVPRSENTMRDFFLDDKGRMWFGSPANDKVGYFYLAK